MKCSDARSLFSAEIDGELSGAERRTLKAHVDQCVECESHWIALQRTVDMVRRLPQETPDPSFVGQVLDRVRAFDAGELQPIPLEATRHPWVPESSNRGERWAARLRETLSGWTDALRRPVPAFAAGALVAGAVVGWVWVDAGTGVSGTLKTAQAENGTLVPETAASAPMTADNPFAGLAGELERRAVESPADDTRRGDDRTSVKVYESGVWSTGEFQHVLSSPYDRPRVTF